MTPLPGSLTSFPPALALASLAVLGWLAGGLANLAADTLPRFRADRQDAAILSGVPGILSGAVPADRP